MKLGQAHIQINIFYETSLKHFVYKFQCLFYVLSNFLSKISGC